MYGYSIMTTPLIPTASIQNVCTRYSRRVLQADLARFGVCTWGHLTWEAAGLAPSLTPSSFLSSKPETGSRSMTQPGANCRGLTSSHQQQLNLSQLHCKPYGNDTGLGRLRPRGEGIGPRARLGYTRTGCSSFMLSVPAHLLSRHSCSVACCQEALPGVIGADIGHLEDTKQSPKMTYGKSTVHSPTRAE
jgi:hypothetical protein